MSVKTIVYVLSTNYAGSHFTVLQLASHSKCISAGELHRFDPKKRKPKQACHICASDEQCPIFHSIRDRTVDQIHPQLFRNIEEENPEVDTLIDNSKKTAWAQQFLSMPGVNKKFLHIIRDPRALARRWMMNYETKQMKRRVRWKMMRQMPSNVTNILTGSETNVYAWKWVYQNRLITNFLRNNNLDHKTFLYDELVFDTDRILSDIMTWIGHEYEPPQKEYWNFVHHGSQKPEYMKPPSGNETRFDNRWKTYLPQAVQDEILTHRGINEYLNEMKFSFCEPGLKRLE